MFENKETKTDNSDINQSVDIDVSGCYGITNVSDGTSEDYRVVDLSQGFHMHQNTLTRVAKWEIMLDPDLEDCYTFGSRIVEWASIFNTLEDDH